MLIKYEKINSKNEKKKPKRFLMNENLNLNCVCFIIFQHKKNPFRI